MTLNLRDSEAGLRHVDGEHGLVDRRIFSDDEIYQLELERIFARAWNFMAHDSMIPNPGDFFMTFIGEDRVIVVRDNDMKPQVLVNSCRHRGNAVCRAEEGHATSFMCTYHGWTYDLQGKLVGVPGFKEVYHEELDRESWGLIKAAHVASYKGFIFATMDMEAPSLEEYLGRVGRMGLDCIAEHGDMRIVAGIQKYVIPCNWKLAVDNVWDYYHGLTHSSAMMIQWPAGRGRRGTFAERDRERPQVVAFGEYGHAIGGPSVPSGTEVPPGTFETGWRETPEASTALGSLGIRLTLAHPNLFPNLWITQTNQLSLRLPKGPSSTEIWWFTFAADGLNPEQRKAQIYHNGHHFGPAGMFEQDDGENWGESTKGAHGTIAKRYPLNYSMGQRHGQILGEELTPPHTQGLTSEHAQLWHYRNWADWMEASDWQELRATHSRPPEDSV